VIVALSVRRNDRICRDNPAVPDEHLLRSTLRDQWHLAPEEIAPLPDALLSRGWEVTAGTDRYVVRLTDVTARNHVEAGLMAATLGGRLTAQTPDGVLAVLRRVPGRRLDGADPIDQQWWGDRLGIVHRALQAFHHPGLRPWQLLDPDAPHLGTETWLRAAVVEAVTATTRLTVTDRLTYGDPAAAAFVVDPATGRAGLLDCGASGTGPLVYDVAAAIVYAGGTEHAGELIDGYVAAGPVARDELDAVLPVLLRLRWAVLADLCARRGLADGLRQAREALESMPG
jgi:Ser/Thr protein kinase RdoA (MazF antagonist)